MRPVRCSRSKQSIAALRHVVLGVDGSQEAEAAAEFLLRLSLPDGTRVTVVSVIPPLPYGQVPLTEDHAARLQQIHGQVEEETRKSVTRVVEKIRAHGCLTSGVVVAGHTSHELLKLVETVQADMIVVGLAGRPATHGISWEACPTASCCMPLVRSWSFDRRREAVDSGRVT